MPWKNNPVEQLRRAYGAHKQDLFTYALSLTGSREAAEDDIHTAMAGQRYC